MALRKENSMKLDGVAYRRKLSLSMKSVIVSGGGYTRQPLMLIYQENLPYRRSLTENQFLKKETIHFSPYSRRH